MNSHFFTAFCLSAPRQVQNSSFDRLYQGGDKKKIEMRKKNMVARSVADPSAHR
jgi:hypothetical protein